LQSLLRGSFFIPLVGQAKGKEKIRDADEDVADGDKENSGEVVNAQKDQRPAPKKSVNGEYAKVVPFAVRSVLQSSRCRFGTTSSLQISQAVCQLCERSTRASKATTRKKDLQSFFGAYSDDDFFPLMRLLLPQVTQGPSCHSSTQEVSSHIMIPRVRWCVRAVSEL
jgi:hypothetical protein